jgi:hypothetical protein
VYSLVLNFVSGFGQTFFIFIFVPGILLRFHLSEASFGLYYSGLTLVSALTLPASSRLMESLSWRYSSLFVLLLMATSALLLSHVHSFDFWPFLQMAGAPVADSLGYCAVFGLSPASAFIFAESIRTEAALARHFLSSLC